MSPFELLLGVALSAQPGDDCGGLALWPGSHVPIHEAVARARASAKDAGDVDEQSAWNGQKPCLGPGVVQPRLQPGDVVLLHQKTAHRVSPNFSPHVRYQCYFRLSRASHREDGPLGSLFEGFGGLAAHLGSEA